MSLPAQIGEPAPDFSLPSLQGNLVTLSRHTGRSWVILWFSRGFTCPFCRAYMDKVSAGYPALQENGIEVIQIAPNLLESARIFFEKALPPYPFICDPDKRLYARYGLGDMGVLEATRNTFISFSHAAATGDFMDTLRASWLDTVNRNFMRRLNHHALTALEQGVFIVDPTGRIRHRQVVGALAPIPTGGELLGLVQEIDVPPA